MPAVRSSLESRLRQLKVDELWSDFTPPACISLNRRKLRKDALITYIIDYGLSPAQLQILDDLCDAKNTAKTELAKSRRQRHAARQKEYRKRDCARSAAITSVPVAEGSDLDDPILHEQGEHNDDEEHVEPALDSANHPSQRRKGPQYPSKWEPVYISVHRDRCKFCDVLRFVGEAPTFCCNSGKYLATPLPPLPAAFDDVLSFRHISVLSRRLNNTFAFTSIGATDGFGTGRGFYNQNPPPYVAAHGRVYHRLFAGNHGGEHALKWYLYDEMESQLQSATQWKLPDNIVLFTRSGLFSVNPFNQKIRSLAEHAIQASASIQIRAIIPQNEVSAILCLDNTASISPREIHIWPRNDDQEFQYMSSLSPLYEPLQYPLLFPHGTLGWTPALRTQSGAEGEGGGEGSNISQIWLYRGYFLREERFLRFGRLGQEYAVDMFSRVQELRLKYIVDNQKWLRREEAELMGADYDLPEHDNIFLPASFLGGRRWCSNQTSDALCLARWGGQPSFFITFTCNPKWPEILDCLPTEWHLKSTDVPAMAIRVFKLRLFRLMKDLRRIFGDPKYIIHVIEFQKRGLPHAHIAVKVRESYVDPHEIDEVVSACLPADLVDRAFVEDFMVHHHSGPGGSVGESDGCRLSDGSCRFHFPKPLAEKTHIEPATGRVIYKRLTEADRWVVPHNLNLLRRHRCHINFEIAGTSTLFQYLYKYLYKGPDYVDFRFASLNNFHLSEFSNLCMVSRHTVLCIAIRKARRDFFLSGRSAATSPTDVAQSSSEHDCFFVSLSFICITMK